jgi:hypothetical protein
VCHVEAHRSANACDPSRGKTKIAARPHPAARHSHGPGAAWGFSDVSSFVKSPRPFGSVALPKSPLNASSEPRLGFQPNFETPKRTGSFTAQGYDNNLGVSRVKLLSLPWLQSEDPERKIAPLSFLRGDVNPKRLRIVRSIMSVHGCISETLTGRFSCQLRRAAIASLKVSSASSAPGDGFWPAFNASKNACNSSR